MSSSPTGRTSTTVSSTSSRSEAQVARGPGRIALIACGALAQPAEQIIARRGWPVEVFPLNPLLHNSPHRISDEVRALAERLGASYERVVVGYADCGTYGALDKVCADLGIERLPGLHCYDVYAGPRQIQEMLDREAGTYLLIDFLVRSFARTVERELGLDRWPELRDEYFRHYHRMVWLAQDPNSELRELAEQAAARIGLPLEIEVTGESGLEVALAALVA